MPVGFRFDKAKTAAAILYLASKEIAALDKYKLGKLLFLADKLHLVRYGRSITGDDYHALPYGPVPFRSLKLVDKAERGKPSEVAALQIFRGGNQYPRYSVDAIPSSALKLLSQSDRKTLDAIVKRHGSKSFEKLKEMTHEMPAYLKAWDRRGIENRARMDFEDFFEEDPEVGEGALELMLENAFEKCESIFDLAVQNR